MLLQALLTRVYIHTHVHVNLSVCVCKIFFESVSGWLGISLALLAKRETFPAGKMGKSPCFQLK